MTQAKRHVSPTSFLKVVVVSAITLALSILLVGTAHAQGMTTTTNGNNGNGNNGNGDNGTTTTTPVTVQTRTVTQTQPALNLGTLIALDAVLDDDDGDGLFNGDNSDLRDLIVISALFNQDFNTSQNFFTGSSFLGELILLDELFSDNGDGLFDDSDSDLEDLVVLGTLFNDGSVFGGRTVVVESGDTLSGIAAQFLGNASLWPQIASLNNIANANLIYPGQVLRLPSTTGTGNNLGSLILLDEVIGDGDLLNGDDSDLEDLIVLDAIFGGTGLFGNGGFNFGF